MLPKSFSMDTSRKSLEHIVLPTTVEFVGGASPTTGKLIVMPCHQGYGTTIGNALRRVLLSSLAGAAVESVKINGVQHEFSVREGVLEDVIEIILNLKQLAVRLHGDQPTTMTLTKKGKGEVTAADFARQSDVEVMNPDLKICTITDNKITLELEVTIGRGYGYVPVAERHMQALDLGTIAIDSLYSPIRDVGYNIELTRVGDVTNYEKLTMTIETNGTITPQEAVSRATQILMDHFMLVLQAAEPGAEVMLPAVEPMPEAITPAEVPAEEIVESAAPVNESAAKPEEALKKKKKSKK